MIPAYVNIASILKRISRDEPFDGTRLQKVVGCARIPQWDSIPQAERRESFLVVWETSRRFEFLGGAWLRCSSGKARGVRSARGRSRGSGDCSKDRRTYPDEYRSVGNYPLIAIVGPTAAGKSALALALAERLNGEVVNYDSVQLYRGFDVGSGKLPLAERRGVAHHLLDCLEPADVFTAGDYRREALKVLADLRGRAKLPIFAGGTGLYLRALLVGLFEGPVRSEALRERLRAMVERRGREFLHRLLARLDAAAAARIQPRDTQKLIRAVEVCILARQPLSALHARGRAGLEGYRVIKARPESTARPALRPHQPACGKHVRGGPDGRNASAASPSGRGAHQTLGRFGLPASVRGSGKERRAAKKP